MFPPDDIAGGGETNVATPTNVSDAVDTTGQQTDADKQVAEGSGKGQQAGGEGAKKVKLPASIKPPQKTGRFQARISDLVSQRDNARQESAQLREQLSRMRGPSATPGEKGDEKAKPSNLGLNPDDFETYADYVTALVNKTYEQRTEAEKSVRSERAYEQYRQEKVEEFNTKCAPLAEAYGEGFWDAITDPNLPISEPMADAIMELDEIAPYTMLWLAAHPDEAMKMSRLNPRAATVAIGRLASKLDFELKNAPDDGQSGEEGNAQQASTNAMADATPKPKPVAVPRGSSPAGNLNEAPSDKDDVNTWLRKETNRLRRMNPNARFYGAQ